MRRRLFTLCSAVSLLLCVAACVLWVRSYFRRDVVGLTTLSPEGANWYYREIYLSPADSGVRLHVNGYLMSTPTLSSRWSTPAPNGFWRVYPPRPQEQHRERFPASLGFDVESRSRSVPPPGVAPVAPEVIYTDWLNVRVPYWLPTLAAALLPSAWLFRRRRRLTRARGGRCLSCGYDLRASQGRCPECGTATGTAAAA